MPLESLGLAVRPERTDKRLEFAKHDMVCVFEREEALEEDIDIDIENDMTWGLSLQGDEEDHLEEGLKQECHLLVDKYGSQFCSDSDDCSTDSDDLQRYSNDNWWLGLER